MGITTIRTQGDTVRPEREVYLWQRTRYTRTMNNTYDHAAALWALGTHMGDEAREINALVDQLSEKIAKLDSAKLPVEVRVQIFSHVTKICALSHEAKDLEKLLCDPTWE